MSHHMLTLSEQLHVHYLVCHRYELHNNWQIVARRLPHDVLWLVASGRIHYTLDQTNGYAAAGDLLLLPQDAVLSSRAISDQLTIISLNFSARLTALPHRRWHELFALPTRLSGDAVFLRERLQAMAQREASRRISLPLLQQADTLLVLAHLLEHLDDDGVDTPGTGLQEARIDAVVAYMQAHPQAWPSVEQLADVARVSPSYLGKLFVRATGLSTRQFLIHLKLSRAKAMLTEGGMRVTEIADQLGYESSNYFTRQFKKATGMTPGAYRQSYSRWM